MGGAGVSSQAVPVASGLFALLPVGGLLVIYTEHGGALRSVSPVDKHT